MRSTYDERPPIQNDNQRLALEYIRQHPNLTAEEVCNFLVPFDHADDIRKQVHRDIEFLVWNHYIRRDKDNHYLTVIPEAIR